MAHAAQRRPIAAFSVGLFYKSSNFGIRTIAYGSCYADVPALSGKAVWIKQSYAGEDQVSATTLPCLRKRGAKLSKS